MTKVSISGEKFLLNGQPTYAGRTFEGKNIEGLLFNVRAVQATFDDANPQTRNLWVYPDTNEWDAERNLTEFMAALPQWRQHGVLGFTVNFQGGGGRYIPEVYQTYDNNGFTLDGEIKPDYAARMERVIRRADELGMAVIVSFFYWIQTNKMNGEEATWRAVENGMTFLRGLGRQNVLVEIANETNFHFTFPIFGPDKAHEMIAHFKIRYPEFPITTSLVGANLETGQGLPTPTLVEASDYLLIHGNNTRPPMLTKVFEAVRAMPAFMANPKPIMINEDSTGIPNLDASWQNYVSWGYYDQGFNGEARQHDIWIDDSAFHLRENRLENLSGFQTPPINWTINTARKRAFFERVAEVTGNR
ncbi:MAG TPA: hypothetical protein VLH85_06100 [Levilinea sp.]|nr:hypothetical protein [Levilinea sp.]